MEADDDEETLLKAEEEEGIEIDDEGEEGGDSNKEWRSRVATELEALKAEGEKPMEELLKDLPPEVLEKPATPLPSEGSC